MPAPEPLPPALAQHTERLALKLAGANRRVYRQALAAHAAAVGAKVPRHIQSQAVKDDVASRAAVSAESLSRTHLAARQRFYEQTQDVSEAKALYKQWVQSRADTIATFEAGQTAAAAARDFARRNADVLSGEEWVSPDDSSGDELCASAIGMGRQAVGRLDPPPYHPRCVHVLSREYAPVKDGSVLWVGGPDEEEEAGDGGD